MDEPSMHDIVTAALADANLPPIDTPAAALALRVAAEIDDGEPLTRCGSLLLRTLDALMMTPKSRMTARAATPAPAEPTEIPDAEQPADELAALRARQSTRAHRAAAVDPAAP